MYWVAAGAVMLMDGAFLSTRLPPTGPAVTQLPALSHTWRLLVWASVVSVPSGTLVVSVNEASAGLARPESRFGSNAEQLMLASVACQNVSAVAQVTMGGWLS